MMHVRARLMIQCACQPGLAQILILADESVEDSAIQADSRSLATLLLIPDIQGKELHIQQTDIYLHEEEELSYRLSTIERAVINRPSKSEQRKWSSKDVFRCDS
ncbi:hypothetical protein H6P81_013061 [Aristolochia fimbriata]|uniref:Uncharacterized protein n=1 Tax=Aristolochia fimbriata TaxID=158543 RepID=A0AAV7EDM2_ARIFI|nr:hypothetical protein H6P81_013061 [Aristolochia fimbriata]